ncbi:unnamed protein product [Sympodiomycopsis kandeliae]
MNVGFWDETRPEPTLSTSGHISNFQYITISATMDRVQDTILSLLSSLPCNPAGSICSFLSPDTDSVSSELKLNGRTIQVVKLLGEGGFSFVYLARDRGTGREFALKKIRCSHGSESFQAAMKEIEAMRRFKSPYIIRILDSAVIQESAGNYSSGFGSVSDDSSGGGGGGKTVYLFLPFYPLGNIQDAIQRHVNNGTRYTEQEMLELFLGSCKAVQAMHRYRLPNVPLENTRTSASRGGQPGRSNPMTLNGGDHDQAPLIEGAASSGASDPFGIESDPDDDDEDAAADPSAYPPKPNKGKGRETISQASLGGEGTESGQAGEMVPYAHRDIKPGNIMVSQSDGGHTPILMDFGSATKARVYISSRREAVMEQDLAAERSTLPYRAPELFDVKTSSTLTESVDIWSLGCTLYAMAYHYSPFETPSMLEQGASTALAVLNNKWDFPKDQKDVYSEGFQEIVKACLVVDPGQRADIEKVIELTQSAIQKLSS